MKDILEIKCKCGIIHRLPNGKGTGLSSYSFDCKCGSIITIDMLDNKVVSVSIKGRK